MASFPASLVIAILFLIKSCAPFYQFPYSFRTFLDDYFHYMFIAQTIAGDQCVFKGGKSKTVDVEDIGAKLKLLWKYQFTAMLGRMQSNKLTATARSAGQQFRLEGADESFEVTLGPDLLPLRIATSEVTVSYGHYVKLGEFQYPLETELNGIHVKLAQIAPGAKQKEKRSK